MLQSRIIHVTLEFDCWFPSVGNRPQKNRLLLLRDQPAENRIDFIGNAIVRLKRSSLAGIFKARQPSATVKSTVEGHWIVFAAEREHALHHTGIKQPFVHTGPGEFDHLFDAGGRDGGSTPKTVNLLRAFHIARMTDHFCTVFEPSVGQTAQHAGIGTVIDDTMKRSPVSIEATPNPGHAD